MTITLEVEEPISHRTNAIHQGTETIMIAVTTESKGKKETSLNLVYKKKKTNQKHTELRRNVSRQLLVVTNFAHEPMPTIHRPQYNNILGMIRNTLCKCISGVIDN